jgi:hypothetical protein
LPSIVFVHPAEQEVTCRATTRCPG